MRVRSLSLALALVLVLSAGLAAAQAGFRVYEPRSRSAEELAPLVAPLLGPDGAAVPDPHGGRLVLEGRPEAVARALAALQELDAELRQYRVESQVVARRALEAAGVAADAWVDRGGLRVARLAAGAGAERAERQFQATAVVLEGSTAELWSGSSRVLRTQYGAQLVPAESGFRVRPRAVGGGEVELEITPVVSHAVGDVARSGEIREMGASTRVRVRLGESLALASVTDAGSSAGADVFHGAQARSESSDSVMLVRVTPADEAAASPER
ncbi:MAG TPA: secretin N-terminal domain-containing protein [Myxococcota bacterium]|nr:secretin N-terminal domain-containing protein [Myxococcota bacterium]